MTAEREAMALSDRDISRLAGECLVKHGLAIASALETGTSYNRANLVALMELFGRSISAHLSRAAEPVAGDVRIEVHPKGKRYQAWLIRDHQSFEVGPSRVEFAEAKWYADMLAKALWADPSEDARDARLFRALVRSFGPEYDLTKGPMHDILLRMHMLPEEEVRHADGSFDFEASIRNVLKAECAIQDAAMKENKDV